MKTGDPAGPLAYKRSAISGDIPVCALTHWPLLKLAGMTASRIGQRPCQRTLLPESETLIRRNPVEIRNLPPLGFIKILMCRLF